MERAKMTQAVIDHFEEEEEDSILHDLFVSWMQSSCLKLDDEQEKKRRRANIDQEQASGHSRLWNDYFAEEPVYTEEQFRRQFKMRKPLFLKIVEAVVGYDIYFEQKRDALGLLGLSSLQKVTASIRMLAYDKSADELDEYLRIGESTSLKCLKQFCEAVIAVFKAEYLRALTKQDLERLLSHSASRGFFGMIGSIDWMQWPWKNCPRA